MPRVTITVPDSNPQPYRFQLDRRVVTEVVGADRQVVGGRPEAGVVEVEHGDPAAEPLDVPAVQVGVDGHDRTGAPQRVVTMDLAKKDEPKQPQVFINPEVTWASDEKATYEEGCLSIPEYYEDVERPKSVKVKYLDLDLRPQEIEADGLLATCLQHEIDHINGVLFIDHISKLKRDMVMKKFKKAAKKTEGAKPLSEDQEPSHHIG